MTARGETANRSGSGSINASKVPTNGYGKSTINNPKTSSSSNKVRVRVNSSKIVKQPEPRRVTPSLSLTTQNQLLDHFAQQRGESVASSFTEQLSIDGPILDHSSLHGQVLDGPVSYPQPLSGSVYPVPGHFGPVFHGPVPNPGLGSTVGLNTSNAMSNGSPIGGASPLLLSGRSPTNAYHASAVGEQDPYPLALPQLQPQHEAQPQPLIDRAAGELAGEVYGGVNIDSGLCKKLADQPAQRQPEQRRDEQKLNLERRGNVEALLAHLTGDVAPQQCRSCRKGHGPWTTCVVYDGQMCGSCTNCWFNASGSRCSFQENSPYLPPSVLEPGASMPMPIPGSSDAVAQTAQYLSSSSGHQSSNAVLHPDLRDFSDVELPASIGGVVSQAWHQGMGSDKLERHKARIADASKELAMRIREYNEWLETPAGRLALQQDQEREQALAQQEHDSWGSQNPETSFETSLESNMS